MSATLTAEERAILKACAERENEIAARPKPRKWLAWDVRVDAELREYGPVYAPADWFGGGQLLSEARRVAFLRSVHRLAAAGLLEPTVTEGNRLRYLKTTLAGRNALAGETEDADAERVVTATEQADKLARTIRHNVRAAVLRGRTADALTHLELATAAVDRIAALSDFPAA